VRVLGIGNRDPLSTTGGYERIWRDVDAELRARAHQTQCLTPPLLRSYLVDGEWPPLPWLEVRRLERHNRRVVAGALAGADAVVFWGMGGLSLSIVEQVRAAGAPAVGVVGDGWMVYGPQRDLSRPRLRLEGAARWLFISQLTRERSRVDGEIVHPGVDPARFPAAPARDWGWRLACVGRVSPEKGVDHAVRALDLLPDAELVADGPGPAIEHPRVRRLHSEDVAATYAAADAVLFPVVWPEPWGLVPLEAMSVGRPVIATATGGQAEYLRDGENALIVPAGDPLALAEAVQRLASDADLRERLREGGFATAARYPQARFVGAVADAVEAAVPVTR
jgi:glycosyltransferase involved in cell wall biosynthesis